MTQYTITARFLIVAETAEKAEEAAKLMQSKANVGNCRQLLVIDSPALQNLMEVIASYRQGGSPTHQTLVYDGATYRRIVRVTDSSSGLVSPPLATPWWQEQVQDSFSTVLETNASYLEAEYQRNVPFNERY